VLAIAADRALGVDVERWVPDIEAEALARDFFSPAERAMLGDLPPPARMAGFFTFWSRKEAYIKATGFGVSRGLDHFDVGLERDAGSITDRLAHDASERWSMQDLDFEPGYSGAVVAEGQDWNLLRLIWRAGSR
jgi:4'-phosphopantetheinyl transferase